MLIGELAERTGVSTRLLRHYEQQGLLSARRSPNGYRHYQAADIETVRRIRALLRAGLPLKTVRELLPCTLDSTPRVTPCPDLVATLLEEVRRLEDSLDEMSRCRRLILDILARSGVPTDVGRDRAEVIAS